jgi:hypothetical protein
MATAPSSRAYHHLTPFFEDDNVLGHTRFQWIWPMSSSDTALLLLRHLIHPSLRLRAMRPKQEGVVLCNTIRRSQPKRSLQACTCMDQLQVYILGDTFDCYETNISGHLKMRNTISFSSTCKFPVCYYVNDANPPFDWLRKTII